MPDLIRRFSRLTVLPRAGRLTKRDLGSMGLSDGAEPATPAADAAEDAVDPADQAEAPLQVQVIASTDTPVSRWGGAYNEILDHRPGAIRIEAQSALLNHDPDQIVGRVVSVAQDPNQTTAILEFAPTERGREVQTLVESGCLSGVSIGYSIESYEQVETDAAVTITATAWTLREISFTPIPADLGAGVMRSNGADDVWASTLNLTRTTPATVPAQDSIMSTPAPAASATPAAAPITPVNADAIRAEAAAIASQAEALGLNARDFVGLDPEAAKSKMLGAVIAARSAAPAPVAHDITIRSDEHAQIVAEAVDSMLAGRGIDSIWRRFHRRLGKAEIADFDRGDMIDHSERDGRAALSKRDLRDFLLDGKRTANTSATFSQVTQLASAKSVMVGYDNYTAWSDAIVDFAQTGDFKTYRVAGAQLGDFSEPAEGSAFSDLTIADNLTGSNALTYRGGGLEFTKQAFYNDELGIFLKKLQGMGTVAHRHQDIKVAAALEALSFSAASVTGPLNAANLDLAWQAFVNATGPVSQKLGIVPKRLVVPPQLVNTAFGLITAAYGTTTMFSYMKPIMASADTDATNRPLSVVPGLHLSSATAFYLLADPVEAQPLTVLKHIDYPVPLVVEVDAGLVASRKFRIEYPMQVITVTSAANKPVGAIKSNGT